MQAIHLFCLIPRQSPPFSSLNFSNSNHHFSKFNHLNVNPRRQHELYLNSTVRKRRRRLAVIAAVTKNDYYSTLNVGRDASLDEIKSSYRKLARKYHPDMSKAPGSEDKFKEVSAAYEVLSNDEKRGLYDRFGEVGLQGEFDGSSFAEQEVDPFQVFDSIFGDTNGLFGGGSIGERRQNLDIWSDVSLTFEESIFGGKQEIEVPCLERCVLCDGTGAKSIHSMKSCAVCGGRGRIMKSHRTPFGVVSQVATCQSCQGDGRILTDKCLKCGGLGKLSSKRTFDVVIPPGVVDGATMQLPGEGNTDVNRRISGDLYLVLHVKEKHGIWREGLNLVSRVSISYIDAILGTVVKVETVEGSKELQIPSGIQPGETVKLSRLGVPKGRGPGRGDHIFIVDVQIPKLLSDKERQLLAELSSLRASGDYLSLIDGGVDRSKMTTQRKQHSYLEGKTRNSLWHYVERLIRGRGSRKGFASATMDLRPTLWRHGRMDHPFSTSWIIMFIVTCIFAVLTNINHTSSQANEICTNRSPNLRRTK